MMKQNIFFTILLFLYLAAPLFGEELRIELGDTYHITGPNEHIETNMNLREYIAVSLTPNEFIKGLEIKLEVPDRILSFRNSFLLTLYSQVNPGPDPSRKTYRAVQVYKQPFPQGKRLFIALPIADRESWQPIGPGIHKVSSPLPGNHFPILIGIKPVMKGIPVDISRTSYPISVKPVLIEKGKLLLSSAPADLEAEAALRIDGKEAAADQRAYFLSPGVHEINITSPSTQPFSRTVVVERGKESLLEIDLKPAASKITFEAPKDARVYLDGQEISDHRQAIETEPGEHLVLVRLGDYTMSKKIEVKKGENYQVSLFFDILIEKD